MQLAQARDRLAQLLLQRDLRVVFAESCTGGLAAATLTEVPGISRCLCGSAVVYRPATKQAWLDVSSDLLEQHTAESQPVVEAMVRGVLRGTPEANWGAAIVGHLEGPGDVWISIARRSDDATARIQASLSRTLIANARLSRQREAAAWLLSQLAGQIELEGT